MIRYIAIGLVAAGAAGCGSLDSADHVHDLRMLSIRSQPAEQVFQLPLARDGGLLGDDGGPNPDALAALATLQVDPITVSALVADPDGGGRPIHFQWSICPALADGGRCDLTDPNAFGIAEGDATPVGGWTELSTTFTPKLQTLLAAVQADAYRGFDFLPVPVQLHITAGNEEVWGFKRLVFQVVFADEPVPTPNQNPYIPTVDVDGELWAAPLTFTDRRDYDVAPEVVTSAEESYQREAFAGGYLSFKESWRYSFFATGGSFSPAATGGASNVNGVAAATDSKWSPDDAEGAGHVTFFIVVRDGRGGEGWTVRDAEFAPR